MARIKAAHRTEALEKIIEARIRTGEYQSGSRLPAERDLLDELGFSRGTIRKAYRSLHHKGYINYIKRSYRVATNIDSIDIPLEAEEKEYYICFFSAHSTDPQFLADCEQELNKRGIFPVLFNLDSIDLNEKSFEFTDHLHINPVAAFFLCHQFGTSRELIKNQHLLTLPLPYFFIGTPAIENKNCLLVDPTKCSILLNQYLRKTARRYSKYILLWNWPLSIYESLLLHKTSLELHSINLEQKPDHKFNYEVHFLDSEKKFNSLRKETDAFFILSPSIENKIKKQITNGVILAAYPTDNLDAISLSSKEVFSNAIKQMNQKINSIKKDSQKHNLSPLSPEIISKNH